MAFFEDMDIVFKFIGDYVTEIIVIVYFIWRWIDRIRTGGDRDTDQDQKIRDLQTEVKNLRERHNELREDFHNHKSEIKNDFKELSVKLDSIQASIIDLATKIK